jgi:hypothetical protein
VKRDQDDVTRICQRGVDHDLDTGLVADQFEISRRRVQQLAKEYRDSGDIPQLETPGRTAYAEYPEDLEDRVLELRQHLGAGEIRIDDPGRGDDMSGSRWRGIGPGIEIDVSAREDVPAWLAYGTPVFTILAALSIGGVALLALGVNPIAAYERMFVNTLTDAPERTRTLLVVLVVVTRRSLTEQVGAPSALLENDSRELD